MVEDKENPLVKEAKEGDPSEKNCDFCLNSTALVYCRADAASLCLACDRHVHAANSVSSKHPRWLLCNSCRSAASSIFCSSHGAVLCSNCDFDAHRRGEIQHERRPVEAFSGCPTSAELASVLGVGGDVKAVERGEEEEEDNDWWLAAGEEGFRVWETPRVVRLDELIVPTSACHGFQAIGVAPLPKNRNWACGKQKEKILQQLRVLIKSESYLPNDCEELNLVTEFQPLVPQHSVQQENIHSVIEGDATFLNEPSYEASMLQWNNNDNNWHDNWDEATNPVAVPYDQQTGSSSAAIASLPDQIHDIHPSASPIGSSDKDQGPHAIPENLTPLPSRGALCPDRDSVISRYKEKRKTRRYDKLIRYESRKARADSRIRIKGRFAKVNQVPKS